MEPISMSTVGMMALGSLMGGGKSGTNVSQSTTQNQSLNFNPAIVVSSPGTATAPAAPYNFFPTTSATTDQSGRSGATPLTASLPALGGIDTVENLDTASNGNAPDMPMILLLAAGAVVLVIIFKKG